MRGGELLDKMALVDPEYLEAAQAEPGEKQSRTQVSHHVSRGMAAVLAAGSYTVSAQNAAAVRIMPQVDTISTRRLSKESAIDPP